MSGKYDFLYEDKHQSFLQADSIVFTGHSHTCTKYPKQQVCNIFVYQKKKGRDEVDLQININYPTS